jgi:hypothetical protein
MLAEAEAFTLSPMNSVLIVLFNSTAKFAQIDFNQRLMLDKLNLFPVREIREYHDAQFTLTSQCK